MTHTAQIILDNVVLVKVEASIYGARKKLKKEDLMLADGTKLPPEDLASLGSKRLLDPDKLAEFNRLKKEAERICLRIGTRFLGGYAIPCASVTDTMAELERIALEFAAAKVAFLAGYDAAVTDWVVRHPEFADILEKAVDSVEFVATRLSFDYLVLSLGLPEALPPADVARLESKIGCLSEQMFYEIAVDANLFIEQSLLGKDQVTRNALRPIKRMRDKLDGLSFLDYRVAPLVSTIDALLGKIPDKGAIEGGILQEIFATAMLLADPDKIRRHGEGLLAIQQSPFENTERHDAGRLTVQAAQPAINSDHEIPTLSPPGSAHDRFSDLFVGIFDDSVESAAESVIAATKQNPVTTQIESGAQSVACALDSVTTEDASQEIATPSYWF